MAGTPRAELEKLTTPKLRELCLEKFPGIVGVSGMKKEELIEAVITEEVKQGLRPKEDRKPSTASMGKLQLKAAIRGLKTVRHTALQGKDRVGLAAARLQIKRMKRRLRKLRVAS
jgi:hypothetical protein